MAGISCYQMYSNDNRSNIFQRTAKALEETGICYTDEAVQLVLASACSLLTDKKDRPKVVRYPLTDMGSVYVHYNPKTGKNEPTPNILKKGDTSDGTNGK